MRHNLVPGFDVVDPCPRGLFPYEIPAVSHLLHCNLAAILDVWQILGMVIVPGLVVHEAVVIRVWSGRPAIRLDHGNENTTGV
eukprot:838334-Lingulodinium_polyedra.AAC.1